MTDDHAARLRRDMLRCPSGCNCYEDAWAADSNECACDGICCTDDWEPWLARTTAAYDQAIRYHEAKARVEALGLTPGFDAACAALHARAKADLAAIIAEGGEA